MNRRGFAGLLVIGIIALIAIVSIGGYFALKKPTTPSAQTQQATSSIETQPTASNSLSLAKGGGNTTSSPIAALQKVSNHIATSSASIYFSTTTPSGSRGPATNPLLQGSSNKILILIPKNGHAWISSAIQFRETFNVLSFNYQFATPSEDLLDVFVDGLLVFRSDQRDVGEVTQSSGVVVLPNIDPGVHTISFRVDAFGTTSSAVGIGPLSLGLQSDLAAHAGASQLSVRAGSTVTLDGSGSSDSRGVPLKYMWSQVKGVTVILSNPTASTTTFVAPAAGQTLVFQLAVTNPDNKTATDYTEVDTK